MAIFEGTIQEVHDFLGPRIRNKVNNLTKSTRLARNRICERCHQQGELHSAHKHGRDRRSLIEQVLENYRNEEFVRFEILDVEKRIIEAHLPILDTFIFLCQSCHARYDAIQVDQNDNFEDRTMVTIENQNNHQNTIVEQVEIFAQMDANQLIRSINSVGKKCFVVYFDTFRDPLMANEDIIDLFKENENWNENGAKIRISFARRIFAAKKELEALRIIANSNRLNPNVILEANQLIGRYL